MKTYRITCRTMRLVFLLCQLGLILRTKAQLPTACLTTNRPPLNSDINVTCGTEWMDLDIYLCPLYHARYNESQLAVNEYDGPECRGTADWTSDPPVVKFKFPIHQLQDFPCRNIFKIINAFGQGDFSDFSNVQYMNISGIITSTDPAKGMITYNPQITYKYSCVYPMQYFMNNTQMGVSGVNLAIKDGNGTFISTLDMHLFEDENYEDRLTMPPSGLNLKTKIYVAVMATNLTNKFNVLLDRCYTTTSPDPRDKTHYDLFLGCARDEQTKVVLNGMSQVAHFSFEAFRFVVHKNQTISTFYLHCITRLCEVDTCGRFMPNCTGNQLRRKRELEEETPNATVSSPAIIVGRSIDDAQTFSASQDSSPESQYSSPVVAVIVCIVILAIVLLTMPVCFAMYIKWRKTMMK